jgi:hypothetical protein
MAPRSTCPTACPFFRKKGCYGEQWPINRHWNCLDAGERGYIWKELMKQIATLPADRPWRYGDVGDLPGRYNKINEKKLIQLVEANAGRPGFCYTHYPVVGHKSAVHNQRLIQYANEHGFTINISAEGLAKASRLFTMEIAPVVTVLPRSMGDWRKASTPAGIPALRCPAEYRKSGPKQVQCFNCGGKGKPLCARPYRPYIQGFTAHGNRARMVEEVIRKIEEVWA